MGNIPPKVASPVLKSGFEIDPSMNLFLFCCFESPTGKTQLLLEAPLSH